MKKHLREVQPDSFEFEPGDTIPNHPEFPTLLYHQIFKSVPNNPSGWFRNLFRSNGWEGTWVNGVFSYHHYHSTAHEVLGISEGEASITLGGPDGVTVEVSAGDVVVLPAGVGHCCEKAGVNFQVVGAYPQNQGWDLKRDYDDLTEIRDNILNVASPATDPLYGVDGPLLEFWKL
jgi:uncharacterized protein YjlB